MFRLAFGAALMLTGGLACVAADTFPVTGTVINAATGVPLPHAQVYISRPGSPRPTPFITGADGRFHFDLPAGAWLLIAGTRQSVSTYGMHGDDSTLGSALIVGPGQDTSNVNFRWYPPGAISGKVTDDAGEPVEGALAQLLKSVLANGRRVTRVWRYERTNDKGEYRFGWLPGGSYYLAVSGKPWYAANAFTIPNNEPDRTRAVAFVPVYYPQAADPARAAPLNVAPGGEVRADFSLAAVPGSTVTVTHSGPADLKGTLSLKSDGVAGIEAFQEQIALAPASANMPRTPQILRGVPPGHYTLEINGANGQTDFAGRTTVDVNGTDISVEVPPRQTASVRGTVHFPNPASRPVGPLTAMLVPEVNAANVVTALRPDGGFVMPSVPAGRYRIGVGGAGMNNFFVAHSEVSGVPYRDSVFEVAEGNAATVSVTLSDEMGRLKGFAMSGDRPASEVMVLLAPASNEDRHRYFGYQTESDGSFDFVRLPAGKYFIFAVDDTGFEYGNPEAVRPYLAAAKPITIEARGSLSERVQVTFVRR